ncbi:MAG: SoxR reducing system RseC family protein [Coriobacteriia bacterium]
MRTGEVDVMLSASSECAGCKACAAASGGMLMEHVPADGSFRPGDRVAVEVTPQATSRARALVFGLPIASVLGGYLAGFLLGEAVGVARDSAGAVGAILSIAAVLYAGARYDRSHAEKRSGDVRVHAIISQVMPAESDDAPASNTDTPGLGGQDS